MNQGTPLASAFVPSGQFVLRSTLLPFAVLQGGVQSAPSGDGATPKHWGAGLLARPAVRDALFVASSSLADTLATDGLRDDKVVRAVSRYLGRMAGRATPFGLSAGCGVGRLAERSWLELAPWQRHTRLDMDAVVLLTRALAADPAVRAELRFLPNSSLRRLDDRAHYLEVRRAPDGWTHHRASVALPAYLEAVLTRATTGATPAALVQVLLQHDPTASEEEARAFVDELIAQQLLVAELEPAVTGPEAIHGLIERLRTLPSGHAVADRLAAVRDDLAALDRDGPGVDPDRYRTIAGRLPELDGLEPSRLFQVDLFHTGQVTLGTNVAAEIRKAVLLLHRLTPSPTDDPLEEFRRAFAVRYGDSTVSREVPLAEALDVETGVGFREGAATVEASTLLEGIELPRPGPERLAGWGRRDTHLLSLLGAALARGDTEIVLTDADIERLAVPEPRPLPDAFAAMVRLDAESNAALDRGDFRLFAVAAAGPSGARLLGRFCHADPAMAQLVADHLRQEQALRPDVQFAEIVHLPEGRLGNILARPVHRPYEIPWLGRSGAPPDRQLPLDDLLVSVVGARVVLRSVRLGCEVLPRLTSAHNHEQSTGIYGFLCALQAQGVAAAVSWQWGALATAPFLPRLRHGRCVLARAAWQLTASELPAGSDAVDGETVASWRRWRDGRRLPRWVCLAEGDHELPLDLEQPDLCALLRDRVQARGRATLVELFPAPDRLCVKGPDGRHVHEIVLPFVRCATTAKPAARRPPQPATAWCQRALVPGSSWLSLKLYAGSVQVDHLVRDVFGPLALELVAAGAAARWFFVRYADPHHHLRLRLGGDPGRLWRDALPALQAAVTHHLVSGSIWRLQLDTYEREVERYGGPTGIECCEDLFCADSGAVVQLLDLAHDDPRGDCRWRCTLLGMDRLLDDLGFGLPAKVALLDPLREGARRFGGLGAKYRREAGAIAELLAATTSPAADMLARRSAAAAPAVATLKRTDAAGHLGATLPELAASLLHMHCNRMLRSGANPQEAVLYELLYRHHHGALARREQSHAAAVTAGR